LAKIVPFQAKINTFFPGGFFTKRSEFSSNGPRSRMQFQLGIQIFYQKFCYSSLRSSLRAANNKTSEISSTHAKFCTKTVRENRKTMPEMDSTRDFTLGTMVKSSAWCLFEMIISTNFSHVLDPWVTSVIQATRRDE